MFISKLVCTMPFNLLTVPAHNLKLAATNYELINNYTIYFPSHIVLNIIGFLVVVAVFHNFK